MTFRFKEDVSPEDNIKLFLTQLETVDKSMADILKANIDPLLPLPSDPQTRSTKRVHINTAIRKSVDSTTP